MTQPPPSLREPETQERAGTSSPPPKTSGSTLLDSERVQTLASVGCLAAATVQIAHYLAAMGPYPVGDALVTIPALLDWSAADPAGTDAIVDYNRGITPAGYRLLFGLLSPWLDATQLAPLLPYLLYPLTLLGIFRAALGLAGLPAAIAAVLLPLTAYSKLIQSVSVGIPRVFALPIVALAAAALVRGSVSVLVALTIAGALFYPVAGVVVGVALSLTLVVLPASSRGAAREWSARKRWAVLGSTAIVSIACMAPQLPTLRRWGPTVRSNAVAEFPELGAQGRYTDKNRAPFESLMLRSKLEARDLVVEQRSGGLDRSTPRWIVTKMRKALSLLLFALALGALFVAWRSPEMLRFLALPGAAAAGFVAAVPVSPLLYLPPRYLTFTVPIVVAIVWATVPTLLGKKVRLRGSWGLGLLFVAGWIGFTGWAHPPGRERGASGAETAIHAFAAGSELTARFAGFPTGPVQRVGILSRRLVYSSFELHNIYHRRYALELRERTRLLTTALFGSEVTALQELRDRYEVRYLIVDRRHLQAPPRYFQPFVAEIVETWTRGRTAGFVVESSRDKLEVFSADPFFVLDLARLGDDAVSVSR